MKRLAERSLQQWFQAGAGVRKPLVIRGARQVGKSYLVREFCRGLGVPCFELNFEKDKELRRFFVEGPNSKTVALLDAHFGARVRDGILFLDEIQAAPEVFARLRYFLEDTPDVPVIAAGSLLEFILDEAVHSIPVGRLEYLYLGPMGFEEFLLAHGEDALLRILESWTPGADLAPIQAFHSKLLGYVRDYGIVGGMPEAVGRFVPGRDYALVEGVHRSLLETYVQDFAKYRKRISQERLEKIFRSIPAQIGKKWVHARVAPGERAGAMDVALTALCRAQVAHRVYHSSGNGVPLAAERNEKFSKVLFLDIGLMSSSLGYRITDWVDPHTFERVNEGALAEQWIGQQLMDLRHPSQAPELQYWVREKTGAQAELDYLVAIGPRVVPVEVKAGSSGRAKSLHVFLQEKKNSAWGVQFSLALPEIDFQRRILRLPLYLVGQMERVVQHVHREAGHTEF